MFVTLKSLINIGFYKTQEVAQKKVDLFYAIDRLSDEEYAELSQMIFVQFTPVEETPTIQE